jgi:nucleotide-binding universal stress UspA family protein
MTVLACVDGSRYTTAVCEYAARTANRLGVGVRVLHVLDRTVPPVGTEAVHLTDLPEVVPSEFDQSDDPRFRLALHQANTLLAQSVERVQIMGVSQVESSLVFGELTDQLAEFEANADVVVIGKRGEWEGQSALHLGSNLERVVRASQRPTLIVPPHLRPLRRFVIAYDGRASSEKAIDFLINNTLLIEAECHLLMVTIGDSNRRDQFPIAAERLRAAGYQVVERLQIMEPGRHDEAIIAAVEKSNVDLLVMGAYGHSRIRNLIIGSTTTALLRGCTVPILVVR